MTSLLVTGSSGFLGRNILEHLQSMRLTAYGSAVDLTQSELVNEEIRRLRPDVVLHLASSRNPVVQDADWVARDRAMAANILTAMECHSPLGRVVFAGSAAQYGSRPDEDLVVESTVPGELSSYGQGKQELEDFVLGWPTSRLSVVSTRIFNTIGPGQGVQQPFGSWIGQISRAKNTRVIVVRTGNLSPIRDFVDVRDVAAGMHAVAISRYRGVLNLGSGIGTSLGELSRLLDQFVPMKLHFREDQNAVLGSSSSRVVASCAKIREHVGWYPRYSLAESVRSVVATDLMIDSFGEWV